MSLKEFNHKIVLITGGASGIGKAIAEKLAMAGAILIIADLQAEQGQQVAQSLSQQYGSTAQAHGLDVCDAQAVSHLLNQIIAQYGRLDYLFNNAGIGIVGEMQHISLEQWQRVIQVNLMGVVHGCMEAYKIMLQQGSGHIINTASLAGLTGFPTAVPYAASKHAVIGLSRSLRAEGKDLNIKVSAICPGFVESNLYDSSLTAAKGTNRLVRNTPFRRMTAAGAADIILKGVLRNRELIIFPFYSRLIAWLTVLFPAPLKWIYQKNMRNFRQANQAGNAK
jgi:NAD(P)-dependent dehydrogenase (short-subunit alcohol dehydrogenase family)